MDSRSFNEIFPRLSGTESEKFLSDAKITRLCRSKNNPNRFNIHALLPGIVSRRRLRNLEKTIGEDYFPGKGVEVHIIEKYDLSDSYTAEMAYKEYKDSILEELHDKDRLLYVIMSRSKIIFPGKNEIVLSCPDLGQQNSFVEELVTYLYKVFNNRLGIEVKIETEFFKPKEGNELIDKSDELVKTKLENISRAYLDQADDEKESLASENEKKEEDNSSNKKKPVRKNDNPDIIYGRDNDNPVVDIISVNDVGSKVIRGKVISYEEKPLRKGERTLIMFALYDGTDSISCKLFADNDDLDNLREGLSGKNKFVKVIGASNFDTFDQEIALGYIKGIVKITPFALKEKRSDDYPDKRVELHCHTKMSNMDAVSNASDIIKQAHAFGHKAIAITDHGVVQAFPEAYHTVQDFDDDMKIIYGVEAYLVDDEKKIVNNPKDQDLDSSFVVFDLETTGLNSDKDRIIEIGAVRFEKGAIVGRFSEFVNPERPIPYRITELTSINDSMVRSKETIESLLPKFLDFSKDAVMVAHNADFDMSFIKENCLRLGLECPETYMDTVEMARFSLPGLNNYKLDRVAKALDVSLENHHRAVDDAECTAHIFEKLAEDLRSRGLFTLSEIDKAAELSDEAIRRLHQYHCIILAKNDIGRINLYRLVSASHLKYFSKVPKMPKSLIRKYREGLILGSACSAGELYEAVLNGRPESKIREIASFYDYLEVQPIGNDRYLIDDPSSSVQSEEDLRDIIRKIVKLGEDMGKPVAATCDVHFLNPEDEVYRRIIMAGLDFKDADNQPPLYLHTTEEMLQEFAFLGSEKAREIVIDNTVKISDMIDKIAPVRPDKCPPVILNSDEMLKTICYNKAHELYGEDLPEPVVARLERELKSIISNGYAVMYIIAQKLVWKSREDGYLVGSRGSVGSSFVATMAGITEVNPLSAHYRCPHCHYVDFDSPEVKAFAGRSGCDMPDRKCPVCGSYLAKEGFDIPFETFLGFKGNKEPDIDLNFSGDYQGKAHRYTEVIFGEGQTFKAGTIGTLADKTAYGYIKKYYEEKGIPKRKPEIDRLVQGCVGVRRSTGQHPGGIIVLPMGEEINTFTPVQHPANDMTSDVITTHFDYHSIDANLLKLDILGHDDPTMIRMLEDLTGLDATKIPLDDKGVMSLFKDTSALGVGPHDLWKCDMGTLGIPEFGTNFAMGLLKEAKPKEFSDLIRISGLSHGTGVWKDNTETLINNGTATISTAICCRDDIMVYLINKGLDSEESFTIMERVRKGKVAKGQCKEWDQYKKDMKDHGVPDWYIWSCEQIQYMFPKAHAAAYVMMAWRIAYCKVYYPLAYYAAFFSIRASDTLNYEMICLGKDVLEGYLKQYDEKEKLSSTEDDTYRDMRIAQEMYARGYEFLPVDLYESDARYFKVVDGKLLPPLKSISSIGVKAGETLQIAASHGRFLSKDDLRQRGKISKAAVDDLERLGIIKDLPENNQLSIFDFANVS